MVHFKDIVWTVFLLYLLVAAVPRLMSLACAPRPQKESDDDEKAAE